MLEENMREKERRNVWNGSLVQSKAGRDASRHSYTLTVQMAQLSPDTNVTYLSLYKATQDVWPSIKNYKTHKKNEIIIKRQRNDPNVGSIGQGTSIAV